MKFNKTVLVLFSFLVSFCFTQRALLAQIDQNPSIESTRKEAELGNVKAQMHLSNLYRDGKGVDQDYTEALKWYNIARSNGLSSPRGPVGISYEKLMTAEQISKAKKLAQEWIKNHAKK